MFYENGIHSTDNDSFFFGTLTVTHTKAQWLRNFRIVHKFIIITE